MRLSSLAGLTVVVLLALPIGSAAGQSCTARPGSAAVDQYCEAIPSADGDQLSPTEARSTGRGGITPKTAATLRDAGADGASIVTLAGGAKTAGGNTANGKSGASASADDAPPPGAAGDRNVARDEPSNNPLKAIASSAGTGPTAGGALLWVLIALTIAVVGLGWLRFRRD